MYAHMMQSYGWRRVLIAAAAAPLLVWSFGRADFSGFKAPPTAPVRIGRASVDATEIALRAAALRAEVPDPRLLRQRVLAEILRQAALDDFAASLGLTVSDQRTAAAVRAMPVFTDPASKSFSPEALDRYAKRLGVGRREVTEYIRGDLVRQTLVRMSAFDTVPAEAAGGLLRAQIYSGRDVALTVLSAASVRKTLPPAEESALRAYYETHREDFRIPERRRVTMIEVSPASVRDRVRVPEADVRAAYEPEKARLSLPEKRTIRQHLFADEKQARAFVSAPNAAHPSVVLGTFTAAQVPQSAAAVFHLPVGGYSAPQQTPFGIAVYQLVEIKPGYTPPYEGSAPALREKLTLERAAHLAGEITDAVQEDVAGGNALTEIAARRGLKVTVSDRAQADVPPSLYAAAQAWFAAQQDGETRAVEVGDARTVFYRIDGVTPSVIPAYESVAAQVRSALQTQNVAAELQRRAERLVVELNTGKAAPSEERIVRLQRFEDAPGVSDELKDKIFAARIGTAVFAQTPSGDAVVAAVRQVTPPAVGAPPAAGVGRAWADSFGGEVLNALLIARGSEAAVDPAAFDVALRGGHP